MHKLRLLTPGPVEIPPDVLLEMARPILHHRTPEYRAILAETVADLQYVFETKNNIIVFSSSGTGAMEAAVMNVLSSGDRALVVKGGKFGERWVELCQTYGAEPHVIDVEPGASVDPEQIGQFLATEPGTIAVYTTLCETSTGAATDVQRIGEIVKGHGALLVVDGISSVGAVEMRTDEWNVDILVVGSQKALMIPPGLAFAAVSEKAWQRIEKLPPRGYYFDLRRARKKALESDHPFTPAVPLVRALRQALRGIRDRGVEAVWREHGLLAEATRTALRAIELELFAQCPSSALTTFRVPDGIDGNALVKSLQEQHGAKIAGGQDQLKGRIGRISHMGHIDHLDALSVVAALEMCLQEAGYALELGAGVKAFQEVVCAGGWQ